MSTAVILAGGKSKRMGRDKLVLTLGGKTLLETALYRFEQEFENVYLSIENTGKYPDVFVRRIVDILPGAGPLSGLHAALKTLSDEGVFLAAADLPFSDARAAKRLIELCGEKEACLIRLPDGKLEPLFGYYKKSLLRSCEEAIKSGENRMTEIIGKADTRYVNPGELGDLWNEKLITNINYPADYERITRE